MPVLLSESNFPCSFPLSRESTCVASYAYEAQKEMELELIGQCCLWQSGINLSEAEAFNSKNSQVMSFPDNFSCDLG